MEDTNKEPNTPDNSVPGAPDVSAAEGGGNDSDVKSLAEVVNQQWGTNFKDDAAALQGLKDNAVLRGKFLKYRPYLETLESAKGGENQALKFMEDITKPEVKAPEASQPQPQQTPAPDLSGYVSKDMYEKDLFFSSNPALKAHEELLNALKATNPGKSWDEVKDLPAFKPVLEAEDLKNARPLTSSSRVVTPTPSEDDQKAFRQARERGEVGKYLVEKGAVPIPKGLGEV